VLTPLVFAPLAGAATAWLAEHAPGVEISESSVEEVFIAGALIGLAPAAQWLHGWQKWEAREDTRETAVEVANAANLQASVAAGFAADEEQEQFGAATDEALDEFEDFESDDGLSDLDALDDELFADEQLVEAEG
jgi:hypothetical protein